MPQFIPNGPNVPDQLVQDLEDDRVVLFCGAGISVGAGLPDFRGLVEYAYNELGVALPSPESSEWQWLDRMLGTLEAQVAPSLMREKISERLSCPPQNTELHKALLRLSRLKHCEGIRLVTTNFDTYFEHVEEHGLQLGDNLDVAPTIPVPRNDSEVSWQSVVHLHGRIRKPYNRNHHLVLTSADFGRAYLTEGWAARFVARLFDEFSVLFVGYSVNDPVLRYMTDAFAAEATSSRRRASRQPAYVFIPDDQTWVPRSLKPISYDSGQQHELLRATLIEWARRRDDWLKSRQTVVQQIGSAPAVSASPSERSNLIWAIGVGQSQDDPLGTQLLAKLNIPIEWLPVIEERETELVKERAEAHQEASDQNLPLSPAQQHLPVHELLVRSGHEEYQLSKTARAVQHWITLNLNSRDLIRWVCQKAKQGLFLHGDIIEAIRRKLRNPDLKCTSVRRRFWRVVCVEALWRPLPNVQQMVWDLVDRLKKKPGASDVRVDLLTVLRPYLQINPTWHEGSWLESDERDDENDQAAREERLSSLTEIEVKLVGGENLDQLVRAIDSLPDSGAFLADLSDVLTAQLNIALDLWALAEKANTDFDMGHYHRPSIEPHGQNPDFYSWTWLIELLWRAWRKIDDTSEERSRRLIARWLDLPYPTFHRLALAATARSRHTSASEKLKALLDG